MAGKSSKASGLTYKGRPLVRSGPVLYYGSMADDYVAMLTILSTTEVDGLSIADKVSVQVLSTDSTLRPKERIAKKTEKNGLYEALNIASIWLSRMEKEKN